MFYTEGRFKAKSGEPVNNYLTRATVVYVNEDGKWKTRASYIVMTTFPRTLPFSR